MTHKPSDPVGEVQDGLKAISVNDFMNFGLGHIAYIRTANATTGASFTVHAANGLRLSITGSFDDALSAANLHNLETVTLH
ncbi:MAG: DUF1150 domain-containing protein [Alphaproteobacteria bacterium]|nr:DUF1150 domain-containing protein [Alphaproteobacteria bacterium]